MSQASRLPTAFRSDAHVALLDLQSALDLESFWKACIKLIDAHLPHCACSLLFNIVDFERMDARHHVSVPRKPDYIPPSSLTISGPYLEQHPDIKMYTYSQIASEDADAPRRRLMQEPDPEWNEFIHLAFWRNGNPDAVLSIHRPPDRWGVTEPERRFLEQLHPMVEAGLRRLRNLEHLHSRQKTYEQFLRQVPLSVLFVDAENGLLFATVEGSKQCQRWNRCLKSQQREEFELPGNTKRLFMRASGEGAANCQTDASETATLRHPELTGLTARIERSWHFPGLNLQSCHVVTFVEVRVLNDEPAQPSEAALLVLRQLTISERRVAQLVAEGLRNNQIAERLCRSPRTIDFQLNSIYRKLGINSRSQLVRAMM